MNKDKWLVEVTCMKQGGKCYDEKVTLEGMVNVSSYLIKYSPKRGYEIVSVIVAPTVTLL